MAEKPTNEELVDSMNPPEQETAALGSHKPGCMSNLPRAHHIRVSDINIVWNPQLGSCTFEGLPVAMMWVDTTLAGLMSGVQAMVGTERFGLALQSQGRKSVDADWQVVSQFPDFANGFRAIANVAAVAGWGDWKIVSLDEKKKEGVFRIWNSWEGRYQKALGVCWGSGMLAGKMTGYMSKLFGVNCWAKQTAFIAKGDPYDEFAVRQSERSLEKEIENLLASDEATRADMAVALHRLRNSQARLNSIFTAAPVGIGLVSNRVLKQVNDRICEMTGYARKELLEQSARMLYPSQEEFEYVGREKYRLISQQGTGTVETRWLHKDGSIIDVLLSSTPLDPNDLPAGVTFTALDITDRKRAERQREALIAELEAKNAELEQFTYTVSHDLKSPLITIKGFLGMLKKNLTKRDEERIETDMKRISDAAVKMEQLLEDLLALSRIGRFTNPSEAVPFGDLVREAVEMVEGDLEARGVAIEIAPELPVVYGDHTRLREVMQNLIDNAVKFMGAQQRPLIQVGVEREGNENVFYVRDNGSGIDPKYHDKVFGLFDRLEPKVHGTGIGLAIVKRIVEFHGGRIWIDSMGQGQGATFRFTVPRKDVGRQMEG